jgi:hypothetical protein
MRVMKRVDIEFFSTQGWAENLSYEPLTQLWRMRNAVSDVVDPVRSIVSLEVIQANWVEGA